MLQFKVIVRSLNKRKSPVVDFADKTNIAGEVFQGFTFESAGNITNKLGVWYNDRDGFYYWSGGLDAGTAVNTILQQNSYFSSFDKLINWNERLPQLPDNWKETKGRGVKIAILDTGIFKDHEDLKKAISYFQDFTLIKDEVDYAGHGTHVAGIIGARSTFINGVIGVAPMAELIILKVLPDEKDGDFENYQSILDALDMAVNKGADIINISLDLNVGADPATQAGLKIKAVEDKIKEITGKHIAVIAAGADNSSLKKELFFPASCEGVISAGAFNEGYFERNPGNPGNLDIAGPFINYTSTFRSPIFYEKSGGSSMTTAFISGIIALAISFKRTDPVERFTKNELLSMLNDYSVSLEAMDYNDGSIFNYHLLNQV